MYLPPEIESVLFQIYHEYQQKLGSGMPDEEARKFTSLLPGDSFLNGLLSTDEQLVEYGMITIENDGFSITRAGTAYCRNIITSDLAYQQAISAQKEAEAAKREAHISRIVAIASTCATVGMFLCSLLTILLNSDLFKILRGLFK